jgi:phospholipid N-methyltransferase
VNTYSHMLQTMAIARGLRPDDRALARSAAIGATLPDLPYLARGARLLVRRHGRVTVAELLARLDYGGTTNWAPDLALHSLIVPAAVMAAAGPLPRRAREHLRALAAGWAGHCVADVATHGSDARPALWPVSRRRWHSPLSTWEAGRHAVAVTGAEHILTALAVASLAQQGWKPDGGTRSARKRRTPATGGDLIAFASRFVRHPARMGAIVPTSQRAVAAMLDGTDLRRAGLVVELGAGTGVFTRELLRRSGQATRIVAFETDPVLYSRLAARLADKRLTLVPVTAERMRLHLDGELADAVVSAVPLTSMPASAREQILAEAAAVLAPDGTMLAIQYSPARQADLERVFTSVRRRYFAANIPPALLYTCSGPRPGR